jgi:putative methyltransferase (TIGR04325 family)
MTKPQGLFLPVSPARRLLRRVLEIALARTPVGRWLGAIPFLPNLYAKRVFARRDHPRIFTGIYPTYAAAAADIPPSRSGGWNHDDASTLWVNKIDPVILSTYPVFFWLSQLLRQQSVIVDVGGSIGLTYYGYRRYGELPPEVAWIIVELPKLCEVGRRIAEREGATNLTFTDDLGDAPKCEILLSAGALQFMEHSIPGLLERLPSKPPYLLLNKLPVTPHEDCWTLENFGPAVSPQRLFNERKFLDYFAGHGYRLRDRWVVENLDCLIPFHPNHFIKHFSGFLFELVP